MRSKKCWQIAIVLVLMVALPAHGANKKKKTAEPSPLDLYLQEALKEPPAPAKPAPGSLWSPSSRLTDLGSDVRAAQVDDIVTILVNENASAVATGTTKTSRASSAQSSIASLLGVKSAAGALSNLLNANTATALDGEGTTSRVTTLTDTLSARVTHVLPNGYLVVEATKNLVVNSEHQTVKVRGVIRPTDLSPGNIISSSQIAQVEINIDGKGVINDSIHRPNIIYRFLLGLLPF